MTETTQELIDMARAAKADERLSDGALYGKLADEIERLRDRLTMKKIRFYIGRALMHIGMCIMPFEADASIGYNVNFLKAPHGDGEATR